MQIELPAESARLTQLDLLAIELVEAARPVDFRPAVTLYERLAAFRLRGRSVIERGWMDEESLPGELESDQFDMEASAIGGWLDSELVASARLIWPDASTGTPLQSEFGITPDLPGVVHLDRICVDREHSDRSGSMTTALIAACWLAIRECGYHRFSGIDSAAVTRLYRRLGFTVTLIGEPRWYWAEERSPILFDPLGKIDSVDLSVPGLADRIGNTRILAGERG